MCVKGREISSPFLTHLDPARAVQVELFVFGILAPLFRMHPGRIFRRCADRLSTTPNSGLAMSPSMSMYRHVPILLSISCWMGVTLELV